MREMEIILDSKFLMNMVHETGKVLEELDEDYMEEMLCGLPINLENVQKFYDGELVLEDNNLLKLINDLSYLDNSNLEDILLYAKYMKSEYIEANLNGDLKRIYDTLLCEDNSNLKCVSCCLEYMKSRTLNNDCSCNISPQYKEFYMFVKRGNLKLCKYIYFNINDHIYLNEYTAFKISCEYGHLKIAKWLYSFLIEHINIEHNSKEEHMLISGFKMASHKGHLEIIKWLYFLDYPSALLNLLSAFVISCSREYLEIAKFIYYELCDIDLVDNVDLEKDIDKDEYLEYQFAFENSCKNGHLDVAKWLYSLGKVDINFESDDVFGLSCSKGYLKVAKWLYSLGCVDIHANSDYAFKGSCLNRHLAIAKWLYSLGGIDISIQNIYTLNDLTEQ